MSLLIKMSPDELARRFRAGTGSTPRPPTLSAAAISKKCNRLKARPFAVNKNARLCRAKVRTCGYVRSGDMEAECIELNAKARERLKMPHLDEKGHVEQVSMREPSAAWAI